MILIVSEDVDKAPGLSLLTRLQPNQRYIVCILSQHYSCTTLQHYQLIFLVKIRYQSQKISYHSEIYNELDMPHRSCTRAFNVRNFFGARHPNQLGIPLILTTA